MKKCTIIALALILGSTVAFANDWPNWRGPDHNAISKETGLLKSWPDKGPPLAWTYRHAGVGHGGTSVVGNTVYLLGSRDESDALFAIDVATGKEQWVVKLAPIFTFEDNEWGDGPRSNPTVDGNYLYAELGGGDLICLDVAKKGAVVWRTNFVKDMKGEMMSKWGYSESPLVDGNMVVCSPGGSEGTLAALDKLTGKVIWRSKGLTQKAAYSSITPADINGVHQYVQQSYINDTDGGSISGVAAKDGKVLWTTSIFKGQCYALCPTPVVKGNLVYTTSTGLGGCHCFEIGSDFKVKDQYSKANQKTMKNSYGGVVLVGDNIYGHSAGLNWACQDFKTGNILWDDHVNGRETLNAGSGAIVAADGHLYLFTDDCEAGLAEINSKEFKLVSTFKLPEKSKLPETRPTSASAKSWAHPTVANGKFYLRDQDLLYCYDIREKK